MLTYTYNHTVRLKKRLSACSMAVGEERRVVSISLNAYRATSRRLLGTAAVEEHAEH